MRSASSAAQGRTSEASSGVKLGRPSFWFLWSCRRAIARPFRRQQASAHDVLIGATAAQIAADGATDLVFRRSRRRLQQALDAHDLAWGTESALECVGVD